MATIDKFLKFINADNQGDEYDDEYSEDYEEGGYDSTEAAPTIHSRREEAADSTDSVDSRPIRKVSTRAAFGQSAAKKNQTKQTGGNMEVTLCKPTTFEDATQIADALLNERSVVLNLEGIDMNLAMRIFDFTTGACYALKGRLEAISKFVYVITPESVYISGDTQADSGVLGNTFGER